MNTDTGELMDFDEAQKQFRELHQMNDEEFKRLFENYQKEFNNHFTEVSEKDITKMQRVKSRVSLKDHRSVLGKELTRARMRRNMNTQNIKRKKI
jgi:hypothetical protein